MFPMVRFSSASPGEGGIVSLVMDEMRLKMSSQYLWMQEHDQKIWSMSPLAYMLSLHLQHVLGV